VVLPSSSAARAVLDGDAGVALRDLPCVVMGPRTEAAARAAGATLLVRAARDEVAALVDAVVGLLGEPGPRSGPEPSSLPAGSPAATVTAAATTAVESSAASRPPPHGLVVVYSGQGKGKTTAALGIVFRALGRGMQVAVVQFIKGKWKTGERLFAEQLPGLTFLVMGKGFTWNSDDLSQDRAAAQAAWQTAKRLIASGEHAVVVVDEITYAINYGFIELADVLETLRARPPHVHVVATGRNAPEELCALADLVTEMTAVKHPFARGIKAQLGIDY
jgi:cob(I)alamin adenosyltransferase